MPQELRDFVDPELFVRCVLYMPSEPRGREPREPREQNAHQELLHLATPHAPCTSPSVTQREKRLCRAWMASCRFERFDRRSTVRLLVHENFCSALCSSGMSWDLGLAEQRPHSDGCRTEVGRNEPMNWKFINVLFLRRWKIPCGWRSCAGRALAEIPVA